MRRALSSVACIIVCAVTPAAAGAQPELGEYEGVVDEYRIGSPDAAVGRLARWPAKTVTDAVRRWAPLLSPQQLVSAAMLHTEIAYAILGSLPSATNIHLQHARTSLDAMAARRDERERAAAITARWYGFVVSLYASDGRLEEADRYVEDGLRQFPRDPGLHFGRGTILEMRARLNVPDPPRRPTRSPLPSLDPKVRMTRTLEAAAAAYRRALDFDRRMAAVRLHLGWVLVTLRDSRARADLDAALADAQTDRIRYLAHLFLGGLAERQNRLDDAAREYAAALELAPMHQTAYVAMSRIETALGHTDRARELARQCVELPRSEDDPWWLYHLGEVDDGALAWLRAEAHRR